MNGNSKQTRVITVIYRNRIASRSFNFIYSRGADQCTPENGSDIHIATLTPLPSVAKENITHDITVRMRYSNQSRLSRISHLSSMSQLSGVSHLSHLSSVSHLPSVSQRPSYSPVSGSSYSPHQYLSKVSQNLRDSHLSHLSHDTSVSSDFQLMSIGPAVSHNSMERDKVWPMQVFFKYFTHLLKLGFHCGYRKINLLLFSIICIG